jgi:phage protein D
MGLGITITVNGSPDPELAEAAAVEVHEKMGDTTTFRIRYPVDIQQGDVPMLADPRLSPGSELMILEEAGGKRICLVKGPVYGQQIHLRHGGADSYVEVIGADASITMDRENKAAVWPDVTDSDVVSSIVGQYGLQPDVDTTTAQHAETKHSLVQRDSDLRFIRRLARRNGCLFWITSDENGLETAHFKRPPLGGSPAHDLVINLDSPHLETLDISWDIENPTSAVAAQLDLNSKSSIDGSAGASPLLSLGSLPLSNIASGTRSLHLATPVDDVGDLTARSEGALIEADFFIRAQAQTTLDALGTVARAHTVVRVRGAGARHSGTYFCAAVRHIIDATVHRMEIELLRNGWEG